VQSIEKTEEKFRLFMAYETNQLIAPILQLLEYVPNYTHYKPLITLNRGEISTFDWLKKPPRRGSNLLFILKKRVDSLRGAPTTTSYLVEIIYNGLKINYCSATSLQDYCTFNDFEKFIRRSTYFLSEFEDICALKSDNFWERFLVSCLIIALLVSLISPCIGGLQVEAQQETDRKNIAKRKKREAEEKLARDKELESGGLESAIGNLGVAVNVDVDINTTVNGSVASFEARQINTEEAGEGEGLGLVGDEAEAGEPEA
jgi:hypothetical protein